MFIINKNELIVFNKQHFKKLPFYKYITQEFQIL